MKLNSSSFRTVDEVVADASFSVGDPDIRIRTLGWYRARVKRALQALAIQTNYYRKFENIPMDADTGVATIAPPMAIHAIHAIWVCIIDETTKNITASRLAYPKTANNDAAGEAPYYFATNNPNADKDYHTSPTIFEDTNAIFYTWDNDKIFMHGAYSGYTHIRIDYSGYGHDISQIGDAAIVPLEVTEAVEGYVSMMYWKSRMGENPSLAPMYDRAKNDLYGMLEGRMSLWDMAKRYLVRSGPDELRLALHNWRR